MGQEEEEEEEGTPPSHLRLVRLPADHVEDLEGGGDGAVLVAVHLCQKKKNRATHTVLFVFTVRDNDGAPRTNNLPPSTSP